MLVHFHGYCAIVGGLMTINSTLLGQSNFMGVWLFWTLFNVAMMGIRAIQHERKNNNVGRKEA
jgi:hypothetical protein